MLKNWLLPAVFAFLGNTANAEMTLGELIAERNLVRSEYEVRKDGYSDFLSRNIKGASLREANRIRCEMPTPDIETLSLTKAAADAAFDNIEIYIIRSSKYALLTPLLKGLSREYALLGAKVCASAGIGGSLEAEFDKVFMEMRVIKGLEKEVERLETEIDNLASSNR